MPNLASFRARLALVLCLAALAAPSAACDTTAFAANSTVGVIARAAPATARLEDPYLVEEAIPGSLGTMEGLHGIVPGNPTLHLSMARAYGSYGFGFMEDRMELAELNGNEELAAEYRLRASLAYKRGKEIAFEMLFIWAPHEGGLDALTRGGLETFTEWLSHFTSEEQGQHIMWAAYNWVRYIGLNTTDPNAVADIAFVQLMADKAKALAPNYNGYSPRALVAGLQGAIPEQLGGHPQDGNRELNEIIALTQRHNLFYLVLQAKTFAVALQDRALFLNDLREVICGDTALDPDNRLQNVIAQRRARRYIVNVDQYFENPSGEAPPDPTDPEFCTRPAWTNAPAPPEPPAEEPQPEAAPAQAPAPAVAPPAPAVPPPAAGRRGGGTG